jgi:hypothetical protein
MDGNGGEHRRDDNATDADRGKILVKDAAARLIALLRDITRSPLSRFSTNLQGASTP